jgi:sec-independent protein translocase protein TatB
VVALLVLGPKKLPAAARAIGRVASELRRAAGDLRQSVELDPELRELPDALDEINRPIFTASPYPRKAGKKGRSEPVPHPAYSARQIKDGDDAVPGPKDSPLDLDGKPADGEPPPVHVEKSSNRPSQSTRDADETVEKDD